MKKGKFNLSHERKLTMNMGKLVPVFLQEALPGDRFNVNTEMMMRVAPMLAPIMHRVDAYIHFFGVPKRILWTSFEDFITGGRNGDLAPVVPYITFPSAAAPDRSVNGSLADYLGLPTIDEADIAQVTNPQKISALPFRAYQMIYNEYYRDQNLSDPVPFSLGDGPQAGQDLLNITELRKRAWQKDYLTSALPWAQRGQPAGAPVSFPEGVTKLTNPDGSPIPAGAMSGTVSGADTIMAVGANAALIENGTVMINELRKASRLQEWLERNARGGARYIEQILAQFGVKSSDARLQRPEYLGGGKTNIVISEVLSTFGNSTTETPQGNMSGHGIGVGARQGFTRRFEEHSYIIGILSVLPKTGYMQGVNKLWKRFDKFDEAWPTFANLGEQEVKESEVYADYKAPANTPDGTFGYQERYAEYKYAPSTVHGEFRDSLAYWHMDRIFTAKPALNENFVMSDPTNRVFAVTDPDIHHLYVQLYNRVDAVRPLPFFGTPKLG